MVPELNSGSLGGGGERTFWQKNCLW